MNLESINSSLFDKILSGVEHIGFLFITKKHYWIIDWEAHFNLGQKKFGAVLEQQS